MLFLKKIFETISNINIENVNFSIEKRLIIILT